MICIVFFIIHIVAKQLHRKRKFLQLGDNVKVISTWQKCCIKKENWHFISNSIAGPMKQAMWCDEVMWQMSQWHNCRIAYYCLKQFSRLQLHLLFKTQTAYSAYYTVNGKMVFYLEHIHSIWTSFRAKMILIRSLHRRSTTGERNRETRGERWKAYIKWIQITKALRGVNRHCESFWHCGENNPAKGLYTVVLYQWVWSVSGQ